MKTLLVSFVLLIGAGLGLWAWNVHLNSMAHARSAVASSLSPNRQPKAIPPVSKTSVAPPAAGMAAKPDAPSDEIQRAAEAIAKLTSLKTPLGEKRAILEEMRKSGQLEQALAALKQIAAENPEDAGIAIGLGEAELAYLSSLAEQHAPFSELGIVAMEADQEFADALQEDPSNWEAQFEKASGLSHWPAVLGKGPEVIDSLTQLIAQQQTMPSQPDFAESYLVLGQEYASSGQPAKAAEVWQQGLSQYPFNGALQEKLQQASSTVAAGH